MKVLKYTREIIITVAVIAIILLFFGPCGNRKISEQNRVLQAQAKALQDKVAQDSIARINERIAEKDQKERAQKETAAAKADVLAANRKVDASQITINRLLAKLNNLPQIPDSDMVKVHPGYVENCDSLQVVAANQQQLIDQVDKETTELVSLMNYEIQLRDSALEKEVAYSTKLREDFNRQSGILENALIQGRPRGKLLAGAGVIGNPTTFLSGAKIALAYQSKGGKQFQVGGILLGGTVYYEAGVMMQLFK
jgi:hypothetical protein